MAYKIGKYKIHSEKNRSLTEPLETMWSIKQQDPLKIVVDEQTIHLCGGFSACCNACTLDDDI